MSISSSSSHPSMRRFSLAVENFPLFPASFASHAETRLHRPGQRFLSKPYDVATSVSPLGWVAVCSSKQVRLYNVRNENQSREIPLAAELSIPMSHKDEKIRDIALSEDLLAVITHRRLLVYDEYRRHGGDVPVLVKEQRIDQNECWTPRSVSISQKGAPSVEGGATASIAVGGEGTSGVKVFRYIYTQGWNVENHCTTLTCPQNNGAIKVVGFSPLWSDAVYGLMAFALSTGNHLYCWNISKQLSFKSTMRLDPIWHVDCNASSSERAFRDEISTATLIISPTGRSYILCTVDHKPGSSLPRTFIVPIDTFETNPQSLRQLIKPLPDSVVGSSVLAGAVSCNGRFVVIVDKGHNEVNMKLLTLRAAPMGGLTSSTTGLLSWAVKLRATSADASRISISISEQNAALEITAVDGQGHIVCSRISVPEMLQDRLRYLVPPPRHAAPFELAVSEEPADRIDIVPG
ncbi:hypothetical protein COCCADRAFT_86072 [Bipolaris zeicola 26-R-13]|uniref:Cleavage/polyadenylation specificity factor A subunit N-terminal domain-containing protein n=1 Tax=Cochliobolus carbonum (strain 26-R-13) TaxID=930089 RepID=W6YHR3_COCC2|nr:uncharacterized protein COCCADRAFT_86072 [Bipolaris zeicola 26-R-13]EUC37213.1 hypothetical protein COCCADRAFT_86072 [Bipolaris zeicola 26-R-13]